VHYNLPVSYVDENLISGEEVRYRAKLHWTALFPHFLGAFLFVVGGVVLLSFGLTTGQNVATISGGAVLAVGLVIAIAAKLIRSSSEFAITNKRVIVKTGIIQRRTAEMFLAKIESVEVDQGLLARMIGYGTISLRGTGGTSEPFKMIAEPLEFRRQVQEQMSAAFEHDAL
jgi:uncharacterized membrane protein YdbT with pleckstrin-like domain